MAKVADILVPMPPALQQTDAGAVTEGAAYSLTLPLVATDPIIIRHRDGSTLTMRPREMYYRDEYGELDPIVDSAPVSVAAGTHHARYERLYPLSDDTYATEPERIKHYTSLYRPPRAPAAYLTGRIEFGLSWSVEYCNPAGAIVPFPVGKSSSLIVGPFTFPQPHADDLSYSEREPDRRTLGHYEVVDTDEGQVLFSWFDAAWFANPDRRYPVTVDPNVVFSGIASWGRRIVTLPSTGRQVALVRVTDGYACYVSDNQGLTWQLCTAPANGIVTTQTGGCEVDVDSQNNVVVALISSGSYSSPKPLKLIHIRLVGLAATVVETQIEPAPPTNFNWTPTSLIVKSSAVGQSTRIALAYVRSAYNYNQDEYYRRRIGDLSLDGIWNQVWSNYSSFDYGDNYRYGGITSELCKLSNGDVWEIFSNSHEDSSSDYYHCNKRLGESDFSVAYSIRKTVGLSNGFAAADGFDRPYWIAYNGQVYGDAGVYYSGSVWLDAGMFFSDAVVGDPDHNRIILVGRSQETGYLRLAFFDVTTKIVYGAQDIDNSVQIDGVGGQRRLNGTRYPVLMGNESTNTTYSHTITFNLPPTSPTIIAPSAFDATDGITITVRHNDPDPDNNVASGVYLKINDQWWNGTALVTDKPLSPIPASSLDTELHVAGIWTAGQSYQLFASTVDSQGEEGPLSSVATVVKASVKPVLSMTVPSSGAVIANGVLDVRATQTVASGVAPASYTVKVYDSAMALVHSTTYETNGALDVTLAYELANGFSGQVGVTPTDSDGLSGDEVLVPFSVQYTPPVVPMVTASMLELGGGIQLTIQNGTSVDPQPSVIYNDVYRRQAGTTAWLRIATSVEENGSLTDREVASNRLYEYMVKAVGENGTVTSSEIVTAKAMIPYGIWLHDPLDGDTAHFFEHCENGFQDSIRLSAGDVSMQGRTYPLTEFAEMAMERPVKFRLALLKDTDDLAALESLIARRTTLCLRDPRGRILYGTIKEMPVTDDKWGSTVDIDFTMVDYKEGV